jgi:hypothetical protein
VLTTTYLLACVLMVLADTGLVERIVLTQENGLCFHLLRFMCNGLPTYIPVDDCIPLDKENTAVYLQPIAFWPLLIEKAWSKILSGYENDKKMYPQEIY